mmetsp:Transcript_4550/g.17205  ORF Transcript_4550/g.17205 Transcript_4550/m.17205 type:complete len:81 (-) Transcript_4550:266-508(-)
MIIKNIMLLLIRKMPPKTIVCISARVACLSGLSSNVSQNVMKRKMMPLVSHTIHCGACSSSSSHRIHRLKQGNVHRNAIP